MRLGRETLEACQDGPPELGAWLAQLAPRLGQDLGYPVAMGVNDKVTMETAHLSDPAGAFAWLSSRPASEFYQDAANASAMSQRAMFSLLYQPCRTTTAEETFGSRLDVAKITSLLAPGFSNVACIRADVGPQMFVSNVPLRPGQNFPYRERRVLRLQRHLAGAFSRRMRVPWHQSAVVLNASGHVEHVDVKQLPAEQLGELKALFARELESRAEPDEEAERLWDALWEGGWTVANVEESDGRRYLTLRRTRPEAAATTPLERQVLALARGGHALKYIALELGLSMATASARLQSGLSKLGLSHRMELEGLAPSRTQGSR